MPSAMTRLAVTTTIETPKPKMIENRRHKARLAMGGRAVVRLGGSGEDRRRGCVVKDFSLTGCQLELAAAAEDSQYILIGKTVTLLMQAASRNVEIPCTVVWRMKAGARSTVGVRLRLEFCPRDIRQDFARWLASLMQTELVRL